MNWMAENILEFSVSKSCTCAVIEGFQTFLVFQDFFILAISIIFFRPFV